MSRYCCKREMDYKPMIGGFGGFGRGNCCCDFPTLIILILIVLQFAKNKKNYRHDDCDDDCEGGGFGDQIGNGILFIIALFFLSCCNPCKTSY